MNRVENRCQGRCSVCLLDRFSALFFLFLSFIYLSSFFFFLSPYAHARIDQPPQLKMDNRNSRDRAKYLTSSSPSSKPPTSRNPTGQAYAFCESVAATSHSPWHIRRLDDAGKKLGGGITSSSLCALVTRGWDLEVDINPFHLDKQTCKRCKALYEEQTST